MNSRATYYLNDGVQERVPIHLRGPTRDGDARNPELHHLSRQELRRRRRAHSLKTSGPANVSPCFRQPQTYRSTLLYVQPQPRASPALTTSSCDTAPAAQTLASPPPAVARPTRPSRTDTPRASPPAAAAAAARTAP
ncbi:hypothetical protein TPAR_06748, partial [Tolypocladium paradoxum]